MCCLQSTKTLVFKDLRNDKDIMQLLKHLSRRCSSISVYVDDGKKKGAVDSTEVTKDQLFEIPLKTSGDPEHEQDSKLLSDDGNGYDLSDEDGMVETYDSLDDDELGSDDDEYKEARKNIREEEAVVPEIIDEGNKVENMVRNEVNTVIQNEPCEEAFSDYVDSDGYANSDSTDEDEEFVRKKTVRYIYDPKCDHKKLNLQLGMRFADDFQCREAIRLWAIYEGHPIHFRRVSKTQLQANCTLPCIWKCYGSIIKAEETFAIKTLVEPHTCTFDIHNKLADYKRIREQDEKDPKNPTRLRRMGLQMTCQKYLQTGHNRKWCKNEEVPKPSSKEKGKWERPRKSIDAPEAPNLGKVTAKVITKERVQARKAYGRLMCEETGNTYLHMSSSSNLYFVPPRSSLHLHSKARTSGTSTNSGTTSPNIPTQESNAN